MNPEEAPQVPRSRGEARTFSLPLTWIYFVVLPGAAILYFLGWKYLWLLIFPILIGQVPLLGILLAALAFMYWKVLPYYRSLPDDRSGPDITTRRGRQKLLMQGSKSQP